jgi:hypothetical protein
MELRVRDAYKSYVLDACQKPRKVKPKEADRLILIASAVDKVNPHLCGLVPSHRERHQLKAIFQNHPDSFDPQATQVMNKWIKSGTRR